MNFYLKSSINYLNENHLKDRGSNLIMVKFKSIYNRKEEIWYAKI